MSKYFALIKNNLVHSIIVADEDFHQHISKEYDLVIDITNQERPNPGDSYYPDKNLFFSNSTDTHIIETDLNKDHLKEGTDIGFEPFKISKYSVKYEAGMIQIGCKKYSAPGFLDILHKVLIEKQKGTLSLFYIDEDPGHGKFKITWEDAQKIYNALKKVKFQ